MMITRKSFDESEKCWPRCRLFVCVCEWSEWSQNFEQKRLLWTLHHLSVDDDDD
jgi:hypothetical protein